MFSDLFIFPAVGEDANGAPQQPASGYVKFRILQPSLIRVYANTETAGFSFRLKIVASLDDDEDSIRNLVAGLHPLASSRVLLRPLCLSVRGFFF
jgi:hypothetical protein